MSERTKIHWCDSTVNPTMGCDGCELRNAQRKSCYAGSLHDRFGGHTPGYAPRFEQVTLFPGRMKEAAAWSDLRGHVRLNKPWLDGPRLIFISDMGDSLSRSVSFEYLKAEVIENVNSVNGKRHRWLWLTKRPDRMAKLSAWLAKDGIPWPTHLWAGTSITDQSTTIRIGHLAEVGNTETLRFLSVEPQVGQLDLLAHLPQVDWVLHGGESGRGARPFHVEWAAELLAACTSLGIPYFLKQLGSVAMQGGKRLSFEDSHASDWLEWPPCLVVRQVPA